MISHLEAQVKAAKSKDNDVPQRERSEASRNTACPHQGRGEWKRQGLPSDAILHLKIGLPSFTIQSNERREQHPE
jgi:hypothetical protein